MPIPSLRVSLTALIIILSSFILLAYIPSLSLLSAEMVDVGMSPLEAELDSGQQVPPNASTATGSAEMIYNDVTKSFDLDLIVRGIDLSELAAAHIHLAAAGTNGPIIVNLGPVRDWVQEDGVLKRSMTDSPFPSIYEEDLRAGDTYINVHTQTYPDGEIRGQLTLVIVPVPLPGPTATPSPEASPSPTPKPAPESRVIGILRFPGKTIICTLSYRTVRIGFVDAFFPRISCTDSQ